VPERYWSWTARGAGGEVQLVVSAFAGSAPGLDRLDVAGGPERWLDSLTRLRGDLELDPGGALLSTWADDPWVQAAYSTSAPPGLAELSAEPLGPLVFAGEHLGGVHAALMEGAIRSGASAARALLASPS
jgi:monoamine oxidase